MVAADSLRRVTLAELVATLSLVADLGMGRPMERVLRQTVVAMRLGAVGFVGAVDSVFLRHGHAGVGEERELEPVLLAKARVLRCAVR